MKFMNFLEIFNSLNLIKNFSYIFAPLTAQHNKLNTLAIQDGKFNRKGTN